MFEVVIGEVTYVGLDRQCAPRRRGPDALPVTLAELQPDGLVSHLTEPSLALPRAYDFGRLPLLPLTLPIRLALS